MLIAAIPFSPFNEPTRAILRGGIKKAREYSTFRNKITHGEPVLDIRQESPTWAQFVLAEGRSLEEDREAVTNTQLAAAERNFNELRRLLWDMHPFHRREDADPAKCLRLILELPNQPHSSPSAQQPRRRWITALTSACRSTVSGCAAFVKYIIPSFVLEQIMNSKQPNRSPHDQRSETASKSEERPRQPGS
jgi:hypothetical protein